jgi:hypothetical protein
LLTFVAAEEQSDANILSQENRECHSKKCMKATGHFKNYA